MQRSQRFISVLLILVSCVTFVPTAAMADELPVEEPTLTEMTAETEAPAELEETSAEVEKEASPEGEESAAAPAGDGAQAETEEQTGEEETEEEPLSDAAEDLTAEAMESIAAEETEGLTMEMSLPLEELSVDEDVLPDNDELFAQYVEKTLGTGEGGVSPYAMRRVRSAGSNLTDLSATVYTLLREKLAKIAAGEITSTVIKFTPKDLGIQDEKYTAEDLGVTAVVKTVNGANHITDEGMDALYALYQERFSSTEVFYALLADCPYDLYWFNKTAGSQFGFTGVGGSSQNGEWEIHITGFVCKLNVSASYSATGATGTYETKGIVGTSVQAAKENAAAIVADHAGESDYDKLVSYFNAICDLTTYNKAAAAGGISYGDPWQLIWVFDGDDTTTVVCEGYSKAFQYLCDLSTFRGDVSCISVSGNLIATSGGGAHMWNVVTMDGENYLVDVTNCDAGSVGAPDKLFMTGAEGSVDGGYTFAVGGRTVGYTYDLEKACSLFDREDLALAGKPYNTYEGLTYKFKNRQAIVTGYTGDMPAQLVIPGTVRGCVVRAISDTAFSGARKLTGVTIPAGVSSIGKSAFSGCSALSNVTFLGKAPDIASNAFTGVTASVGYTADSSWTASALAAYGGTLDWSGALKGTNGLISASYTGNAAWDSNASIALTKTTVTDTAIETAIQNLASGADKLVKYVAYDISMSEGNLAEKATVTVQAPKGFGADCKLWRVESDGTLTNMNAVYDNGKLTFTTEHFSTYIVTRERLAALTAGDVNGDGSVTMFDAVMTAQSLIGLVELDGDEIAAADLNGDGTVNGLDAVIAAQTVLKAPK